MLSNKNPDLIILVDTKLPELTQVNIKKKFEMPGRFSGMSSTEKGIAIFTKKTSDIKIKNTHKDENGQLLILELLHVGNPVLVAGVYGDPKGDPAEWWRNTVSQIQEFDYSNWMMVGDMNLYFDVELDTHRLTRRREARTQNQRPKSAEFFGESEVNSRDSIPKCSRVSLRLSR